MLVEKFAGPSLLFPIAKVHAEEHAGPILRVGTSGTGRNREEGWAVIMRARKKREAFQCREALHKLCFLSLDLMSEFWIRFARKESLGLSEMGETA